MKTGICLPLNIDHPEKIMELEGIGIDFLEASQFNLYQLDDTKLTELVALTQQIGTPITHTNAFFGSMPLFGDDKYMPAAKEYVKRVFEKLSKTDIKHMVLGSGGSRKFPEGSSKEDATKAFFELCSDTVSPLAVDYGYTIGIEPLCSKETNLFVTAAEVFEFLNRYPLPHIKMIIDYYHFNMEKEAISDLEGYKGKISHLHIASTKCGRLAPLPENDEEAEYKSFISAARAVCDQSVCLSIEGTVSKSIKESMAYLKSLVAE